MLETFITFTVNLWILFTNSFEVIKHFVLGLPFIRIAIIVVVVIFIYKMSRYEFELIKDPYIKAGRRRI